MLNDKKIRVGIAGGAGYTGGELIRLLINHPNAEIVFVNSKSNSGKLLSSVHADLIGETSLQFSAALSNEIDVLFLCVGHGDAKKFLEENNIPNSIKVIDLSNDFRLTPNAQLGDRNFIYGLPEINRKEIQSSNNVANPGCFATAIQLGLIPLAKAGLLNDVYSTGITGSTGAGQSFSATSHFSWRANNVQAYKTLTHQHLGEINQSLQQVSKHNSSAYQINFVPWRGDFTRGIFISSQLRCDQRLDELYNLYELFYKDAAFTTVSKEAVFLKQVVNTNKCVIQLEKEGSVLVVHSIIDNLLKGASGQAIQNMNLMFEVEEKAGLNLKANFF
ncbi:MAG: N-acetyl-gamma-glutamyl-phosphate reductase [Chitinophagaceae bacterium]|nr:N-acetyl-gamma-glutamyl-phosphate reductase [Chitinophagaceae bacterium]